MNTFDAELTQFLLILVNLFFHPINAQGHGLFSLFSPLLGNFNGGGRNVRNGIFGGNARSTLPFQEFIDLGLKVHQQINRINQRQEARMANPTMANGIGRFSASKRPRISGPKFADPSIFPFTRNNGRPFNARNNFAPASETSRNVNNFGLNIVQMIGEISQYSDAYQQKDQDYGSVNKLLRAFSDSMDRQNAQPYKINQRPINDGTEIGRNRPIALNLFESDIVLTVDQLKGIVLTEKERRMGGRRHKRKVITGAVYRWTRNLPIPYEFHANDEGWKNSIRSAIAHWEKETCLRWRENGAGIDKIVFIRGSGCYSSVGRTGGRQQISIGYGCEDKGIITHEIGHSLGFWHEQSRPDRDAYIQLKENFIARGTEANFVKRSTSEIDDMALPYDLGSVMHYGPTAFSIDWDHKTIETRDRNYGRTIGQRVGPSFIDVKQINRMYCYDRCAQSSISCLNGGYLDPNNCAVCKCPSGLGGTVCESVQQGECGGVLQAMDHWQQLNYQGNQKCYWMIKAMNTRIRIVIESVTLKCDVTCRSFLEVKYNSNFQQTGFRLCCDGEGVEIVSEQSEVILIFDAKRYEGEGSFSLQFIKDSGLPLPRPPTPVWKPGRENRPFRNLKLGTGGPIERFILNAIPRVRDPQQPLASIASIITDFTVGHLLGVNGR